MAKNQRSTPGRDIRGGNGKRGGKPQQKLPRGKQAGRQGAKPFGKPGSRAQGKGGVRRPDDLIEGRRAVEIGRAHV